MTARQNSAENSIRVLSLAPFRSRATSNLLDHFIHRQMSEVAAAGAEVLTIVMAPRVPPLATHFRRWSTHRDIPPPHFLEGMEIRHVRHIKLPFRRLHGLATVIGAAALQPMLDRAVALFRPDIIHAHGATPAGYVGLRLAKRYRLPVVCSVLGSDIHVYPHTGTLARRLTQAVVSGVDGLVANSEALARDSLALIDSVRPLSVIRRGCDANRFRPDLNRRRALRERLAIPPEAVVYVFVGNVVASKGVPELIDAFGRIRTRRKDVHLLLVGQQSGEDLGRRLLSSGLASSVHLVGYQPPSSVAGWLSAGDVFVLPSHHEGMPNAILEAMACERPVVASNVGGVPEVLRDSGVGMLVEPRDADRLAVALEEILQLRSQWPQIGDRARQLVKKEFDWGRSGERVVDVYRSCVNGSMPTSGVEARRVE